jgi:hypothetical protein
MTTITDRENTVLNNLNTLWFFLNGDSSMSDSVLKEALRSLLYTSPRLIRGQVQKIYDAQYHDLSLALTEYDPVPALFNPNREEHDQINSIPKLGFFDWIRNLVGGQYAKAFRKAM